VLVVPADAARSTSAAAKHLFEDVIHVRSGAALRWALLAKLVVARSGIGVAQGFVRLANFLEFFGVATLVGVVFAGESPVRLFDVVERGSL